MLDLDHSDTPHIFAIARENNAVTACNDKITHLKGYSDTVYCPTCIKLVDNGRNVVDQAFGLWCI